MYDAAFKGSRYDFAAMVFETSGAVNDLRQIIRFASKRECMGNSSFAGRAWARVGCCIQMSVAHIRDGGDSTDCLIAFVVALCKNTAFDLTLLTASNVLGGTPPSFRY